jgi:dynein heavy chain
MRKFANANDSRNYWIVFDGPVDALWIENLNTVLDDNMTLCLASGERIKLRKELRIIFEVQDLAVASPATVSRCGMVYMTPNDLSWKAYYNFWVNNFILRESEETQLLSKDNLHILNELFYQLLDEIFEKLFTMKQEQ